jgi:hypothetical protein
LLRPYPDDLIKNGSNTWKFFTSLYSTTTFYIRPSEPYVLPASAALSPITRFPLSLYKQKSIFDQSKIKSTISSEIHDPPEEEPILDHDSDNCSVYQLRCYKEFVKITGIQTQMKIYAYLKDSIEENLEQHYKRREEILIEESKKLFYSTPIFPVGNVSCLEERKIKVKRPVTRFPAPYPPEALLEYEKVGHSESGTTLPSNSSSNDSPPPCDDLLLKNASINNPLNSLDYYRFLHFVYTLLQYRAERRLTPLQALQHPFFESYRLAFETEPLFKTDVNKNSVDVDDDDSDEESSLNDVNNWLNKCACDKGITRKDINTLLNWQPPTGRLETIMIANWSRRIENFRTKPKNPTLQNDFSHIRQFASESSASVISPSSPRFILWKSSNSAFYLTAASKAAVGKTPVKQRPKSLRNNLNLTIDITCENRIVSGASLTTGATLTPNLLTPNSPNINPFSSSSVEKFDVPCLVKTRNNSVSGFAPSNTVAEENIFEINNKSSSSSSTRDKRGMSLDLDNAFRGIKSSASSFFPKFMTGFQNQNRRNTTRHQPFLKNNQVGEKQKEFLIPKTVHVSGVIDDGIGVNNIINPDSVEYVSLIEGVKSTKITNKERDKEFGEKTQKGIAWKVVGNKSQNK